MKNHRLQFPEDQGSKVLAVLSGLFTLLAISLGAQTKSILFESKGWAELSAEAARQNKLIFLDAYASWCSVCKKMDKEVFSNDSVADFYNSHFINAKFDMERGEGMALAERYQVNIYPTFLFIDPQGKVLHRAEGGFPAQAFLELARNAQTPGKQNGGQLETQENTDRDEPRKKSNPFTLGFQISQIHRDFGMGIQITTPYFFGKLVALRASTNLQWLEHTKGNEIQSSRYQNIQLGMRSRATSVCNNIFVYGEGGSFIILPNSTFSAESLVAGGYGLFGFEFRVSPGFAYYLELGGVGTGARADKAPGKPIYSNGFLSQVGFKLRW